jgi:hypothetical protein
VTLTLSPFMFYCCLACTLSCAALREDRSKIEIRVRVQIAFFIWQLTYVTQLNLLHRSTNAALCPGLIYTKASF